MARIRSIFNISGRIGNVVIKEDNGELIVQSAPSKKTTKSPKLKRSHKRFAVVQNLSSKILKDTDLKTLWKLKHKTKKAVNTTFTKFQTGLVNSYLDIPKVKICPIDYFILESQCELIMEGNYNLKLRIPLLSTSPALNTDTENYIKAAGYYHMYNPNDKSASLYAIESISTAIQKTQFTSEIIIDIQQHTPTHGSWHLLERYNNVDVIIVIVTLTEKDSPVRTSQTIRLPFINLSGQKSDELKLMKGAYIKGRKVTELKELKDMKAKVKKNMKSKVK